jgi:hypothetical protein
MACEYCSDYAPRPLINRGNRMSLKRDIYPGISITIEDSELYISAVPDTYEPGYLEAEVKINFCPMCGRKFEECKDT